MQRNVDVCVVGAGVAGAATAVPLARRGVRVALIDGSVPVAWSDDEADPGGVGVELQLDADADRRPEGRRLQPARSRRTCPAGRPPAGAVTRSSVQPPSSTAEVLPPAAVHALAAMGLDDVWTLGGACRGVLSRWQSDAPGFTDFELLGGTPGRAVDRGAVARSLAAHAMSAGAAMIATSFIRGEQSGDGWSLVSDQPQCRERISCRHLIDASGRAGRSIAGLPARCHHDRAVCLSVRCAAPLTDPTLLLVDRSAHGWWYAVAAGEGATDVAFVTDADLLPHSGDRATWLAAEYREATLITSNLERRPHFGALASRDARSGHRPAAAGEGWLAVGDAALAWDPLSGHGMQFALESAERAAEAVLAGDGERRYPAYARWCGDAVAEYGRARTTMYVAATTADPDAEFWRRRCGYEAGRQVPLATPRFVT